MGSSVPSIEYQVPSGARFQVWDPQVSASNFSTKQHTRKGLRGQKAEDDEDHVTRTVRLSDNDLLHLALDATESIDWQAFGKPPAPPEAWTEAKATKNLRSPAPSGTSASVYTQQIHKNHTNPSSIAIMAHTVVSCSLQELRPVLESSRSDQFCDLMQVIHDHAIVSAAKIVHQVVTAVVKTSARRHSSLPSTGLLVKVVALEKKTRSNNIFRTRPRDGGEWRYLDFVQYISAKVVRKTICSLPPPRRLLVGEEVEALKCHHNSHELLAGYQFEELEDGKSTRISFWGEHANGRSGEGKLKSAISNRVVKSRMLRLAKSIDSFMLVVRRRRLGVQVMADEIKVQSSNTSCACCNRSFLLTRKQVCGLCGYFVCEKCSQMEDRERQSSTTGRKVLIASRVRVCGKCIARVDQCSYTNVSLENLSPPRIVAVAKRSSPVAATPTVAKPTSLLQEAQ